ncbi:DUF2798 domain-containing protein [Acidaminococcus timonensis]|uniref:DUF2798 domain-containing protein n=1 Tax=Acidaminococcus timonensis TaxID=1871002 RepID=UPI0008DA09B0|nr:DUF2798 domain-containing protein [Acidaminococcus timonensis]
MPETRKEAVIFTCMMAFGMVLGMASYNSLLHLGWQGPWFSAALQNFFHEYFLAVPVAYFIGSPIAMRLTLRFWPWKERLFPIGMGIFTPCIMAPLMTTLIHVLFFHVYSWSVLGPAFLRNIAGAMGIQLFLVGPVVRHCFGLWKFRKLK